MFSAKERENLQSFYLFGALIAIVFIFVSFEVAVWNLAYNNTNPTEEVIITEIKPEQLSSLQ